MEQLIYEHIVTSELLKSDSICNSYAQMKKGPVFFWLTVYNVDRSSDETLSKFQARVSEFGCGFLSSSTSVPCL